MPLPNYGVFKGTIIDKLDSLQAVIKNLSGKPHYQIKAIANGVVYRIAVNVKSDQDPPNLQVYRSEHYSHPILSKFAALPTGFTKLKSNRTSGALDFIRQDLFDLRKMIILPASQSGAGNDLNDIFNVYVQRAITMKGALMYAFGSRWADNKTDAYFDFKPGNGVHDIHLNQGNVGEHQQDNGIYQDGALFIHYPEEQRWFALFLKFQSQKLH